MIFSGEEALDAGGVKKVKTNHCLHYRYSHQYYIPMYWILVQCRQVLYLAILGNLVKSGSSQIFGVFLDLARFLADFSETAVNADYLQLKVMKLVLTYRHCVILQFDILPMTSH